MKFEIYHQLGFRDNWNIESIQNDNTGDGIIISPRSRSKQRVENLEEKIKNKAIFDPQILIPSQINKNMSTYDFYPCVLMSEGFDTTKFMEFSSECADKCIDFQVKNNFKFLVIPSRYYDGLPPVSNFINFQTNQYIKPFLEAIKKQGLQKDVIVQLILNGNMIKNEEYASELLNWITGIGEINGVYLIIEISPRNKQISDPDFLFELLKFINALSLNEIKVILGYLNTESILLSIANPSIVTIGSFENLRSFNSRMFSEMNEKKDRRPPNPRVYIPKLLDWIEYPFIQLMSKKFPDTTEFFGTNKYSTTMLHSEYEWQFMHPEPYKHYFIEGSKQLRGISLLNDEDRYSEVHNIIESAKTRYTQLAESGFELGDYGTHLSSWMTAADLFARDQGWRK